MCVQVTKTLKFDYKYIHEDRPLQVSTLYQTQFHGHGSLFARAAVSQICQYLLQGRAEEKWCLSKFVQNVGEAMYLKFRDHVRTLREDGLGSGQGRISLHQDKMKYGHPDNLKVCGSEAYQSSNHR